MTFLRILLLITLGSYLFWWVAHNIFGKDISLVQTITYGLILTSIIGILLWGLSYLIEGG